MTRSSDSDPMMRRTALYVPVLVVALLLIAWTRLDGLDLSMWHDEVYTVTTYIEPGPPAIFLGDYVPNNHMLFNLLAWTTTAASGPNEIPLRFWAALPALAAVLLVFRWLWVRMGVSAASAFLVLAAVHPLLMLLSRQVRGYGLLALLIALMFGAAWESLSADSPTAPFLLTALFGALSIFTLPVAAVTFILVEVMLWVRWRWATIWSIAIVGASSLAWYAGNLRDLIDNVDQAFGSRLPWHGAVSGPLELGLFPIFEILLRGEGRITAAGTASAAWMYVAWSIIGVAFAALGIVRMVRRHSGVHAALVIVPIVGTYAALVVLRVGVAPRFLSFLVLPILALMASGVAEAARIAIPAGTARTSAIAFGSATALIALGIASSLGSTATAVPVEAFKDVGHLVNNSPGDILTNSRRPIGLDYYIDRQLTTVDQATLETLACSGEPGRFVIIDHPLLQEEPMDTTCLRDRGLAPIRFAQITRGGRIDVWLIEQP